MLKLQDIQKGSMQHWKTQAAPEIAISYWKLQVNIFNCNIMYVQDKKESIYSLNILNVSCITLVIKLVRLNNQLKF